MMPAQPRSRTTRLCWIAVFALLLTLWVTAPTVTRGQDQHAAPPATATTGTIPANNSEPTSAGQLETTRAEPAAATPTTESTIAEQRAPDGQTTADAQRPDPATNYDLWVLMPAIVAIALAIITRQVIPSLLLGVFVGAYMLVPLLDPSDPLARINPLIAGFRLATETFILGAITDPDADYGHVKIMVFTLVIGFVVGVIGRNGGTEGMVRLVAGKSSSQRRTGITAWLAGLIVFFDDYANTMIVGPTMQSVFDRVKLSRAKLAYIVDSTAAPVASIALIGTWVGAEIGYIQEGLDKVAADGAPAFLHTSSGEVMGGMSAFLNSIPYRFYPLLALFFVVLIAWTGRDFGPMRQSERKVLSRIDRDQKHAGKTDDTPKARPRWWLGLIPILVLVAATVGVLVATGLAAPATIKAMQAVGPAGQNLWDQQPWWEKAGTVIGNADSYLAIFHGAMLAALVALILTIAVRACTVSDTVESGLDGMARMFPAIVILVLAWALSAVMQELELGAVVADYLRESQFNPRWLPLAIFTSAALISFASGTSWGTMGILCPATVEIAARLIAGMDETTGLTLFYAAVGSVLAGAVFGDHCSPISDTTVLSSIASGCRHEEHVWTQLPYAVVTALAAMGLGDVLSSAYDYPWWVGIAAGMAALVAFLFLFGRRPVPSFELADA